MWNTIPAGRTGGCLSNALRGSRPQGLLRVVSTPSSRTCNSVRVVEKLLLHSLDTWSRNMG